MKDEVYIKLDADTLRMIHEENMTNLKPFDDESFYKVDKALYGYRGSPRYWKDAEIAAAKDLGLKPSKIDNSLYMDPRNFIQYVHVDDELLSRDDRLVRDMVQKLKQKFLVKKVDYLTKIGDTIEILGRKVERTKLGNRLITSSRYIDLCLKDMALEKCNPVSTPGLQVTDKNLATEEKLPDLLAGLYRRVTGRLLCGRTTTRCATSSERACTRNEFPNKHSLGTAETSDAIPDEQTNKHLEVRTNSQ